MKRRDFLRLAGGTALLGASWRLWASPAQTPGTRFLLVFLRGGYDPLSVLIPYTDPFYYESRPHIALQAPGSGPEAALRLDGRWALHPALEDNLFPLYQERQLAFVPFSGTAFVSRSHFQAQDWMEFGEDASSGRPRGDSGFLNRLAAVLGSDDRRAISFTRTLPPVLRGEILVANSPVIPPKRSARFQQHEALVEAMYAGHPLESLVRDGLQLRRTLSAELTAEMDAASREALPAGSFALEAARMGRFLRTHPEYAIGFVDVGGWDTHAAQGAATGSLSNQLRGLGDGLEALAMSMGPEWKKTVVVVLSEFGRTFRENGSRGTDHGHGSAIWVLGGSVRGGAICGEQAPLRGPQDLHQDRDLPVLNEYRAIVGGLLKRLYALDQARLAQVFPGALPIDPGII